VNRQRAAEAALVWNAAIWGVTFVLVKAALDHVSTLLFLALRFSLATVALLVIFGGADGRLGPSARQATKTDGLPHSPWKPVLAGGLTGSFLFSGYFFQTLGLRLTTAPRSAFITGLMSVMVPLLAALVYRNRPQVSEVAGVLVATVGMALMTLEGPVGSMGKGDLLTFLCAIGFAAHIVTLGHFSEQVSYKLLSVGQVGAAALWSLSLFWWVEKPRVEWHPILVYAILVTGLLATALAFTLQAWAQRYTTSTRTALIYTLEPVFAWMTSYFLVGEGLSGRGAAGAALILGGVILVELKPLNARFHPSK
jgi:drug/metabolite transporter (DMT)-like permease